MGKTTIIPKQDAAISYTGNWTGLAGGNEIQMEDAGNDSNASGTFGVTARQLADGDGAGAVGLIEGMDYNYDARLDDPAGNGVDIYDTSTGGALAENKYLRIVENGANIAETAGGGTKRSQILEVYAKDLTQLISPPYDQVYVDPAKGKFVLPRPNYYTKCTDWTNITSPEIGQAIKTSNAGEFLDPTIKFGNGIWGSFSDVTKYIDLDLSDNFSSFDTGTLSLWYQHYQSNASVDIMFSDTSVNNYAKIYNYGGNRYKLLNLSAVGGTNSGAAMDNTNIPAAAITTHLYVVWDTGNGLDSSKSVRVFVDGVEVISTTDASLTFSKVRIRIYTVSAASSAAYSNIKTWEEVVSEDPSWEYNGGSGREDAMHYIYGSDNDYKPKLDSSTNPDSGVGYYYIQEGVDTTVSLPQPTGTAITEERQLEDISDYSAGVGYFGPNHRLFKNDYSALVENIDYYIDEALDGTGVHAILIWDVGDSGALAGGSGRYMRVVHDGTNVSTGIGLKPVAKDTSISGNFPPADALTGTKECWIDISRGKIVLPRPNYWNKCEVENALRLNTAEIYDETPETSITDNTTYPVVTGKFYNGIRLSINAGDTDFFYPFGSSYAGCEKGTMSFWMYFNNKAANRKPAIRIYLKESTTDTFIIYQWTGTAWNNKIVINGVNQDINTTNWETDYHHFYIVWDIAGGLSGGKTIRVFFDGVEDLSTTNNFTVEDLFMTFANTLGTDGACVYFDNLKIWKDQIVSEDPSWEYNSGTGRENALHEIYGSGSDYEPKLTSGDSGGVGYYFQQGGDEEIQLEDASDIENGIVYTGGTHNLAKDDYNPLVEDTDFYYDEELDGSGTHSIDIIDTNIAGTLDSGKYLRIVHNGQNVITPTGLNLLPRATQMISNYVTPPEGEVWVDPLRGKIILPRPKYWSKCESLLNVTTDAEIYDEANIPILSAGGGEAWTISSPGKWNNMLYRPSSIQAYYLHPFGTGSSLKEQGTLSFWIKHGGSQPLTYFSPTGNTTGFGFLCHYIGGFDWSSAWVHVYCVWDKNKSLDSGTKWLRCWRNGVEWTPTTSQTWAEGSPPVPEFYVLAGGLYGTNRLDNIKIWDHIVAEDPAWEYNGGSGREDALHYMYGTSNGYKPALTSGFNGGVGYFKPDTAGSYIKWTI